MQGQFINRTEEPRYAPGFEQVLKLIYPARGRTRAEGLICELRDRHLVSGMFQHSCQFIELRLFHAGYLRGGAGLQLPRQLDGAQLERLIFGSHCVHDQAGVLSSSSHKSVLKYLRPESQMLTAMVLPLNSPRKSWYAPAMLAPEE